MPITEEQIQVDVVPEVASSGDDRPRCPRCQRLLNVARGIGGSYIATKKIRCCILCMTPEEHARMERNLRYTVEHGNTKAATVDLLNLKAAVEKYRGESH